MFSFLANFYLQRALHIYACMYVYQQIHNNNFIKVIVMCIFFLILPITGFECCRTSVKLSDFQIIRKFTLFLLLFRNISFYAMTIIYLEGLWQMLPTFIETFLYCISLIFIILTFCRYTIEVQKDTMNYSESHINR